MAWTAPRTWVASETLTAALLNTHLRDNLNETAVAKVTTKGDIAIATGANALTRLAVGSNGAVLVADSAATPGVRWSSTGKTASGAIAVNVDIANTLTAAANSDSLLQARIIGTFAKSTFTSLDIYGLLIDETNASVSGTGSIANGYALYITPPTIGTTNWAMYVSGGNSRLGGTSSSIYIGDTSNAKMTAGLTINQGANNDEIICLKQSGIAHGITSYAETDTFGAFYYKSSTQGGVEIGGYTSGIIAVSLSGGVGTLSSVRSTAATAAVMIQPGAKSGTSIATLGADKNILAVGDFGTTRFILDSDGDSHQDVGTAWTNFDDRDDVAALNLLAAHVTRHDDPLRRNFAEWLERDRAPLEAARVVTFNEDGHHFVNWSRANMLVIGAVRQLGARIQAMAAELADNRAKLAALETRLLS